MYIVRFHAATIAEGRAAYFWYKERSSSAALAFITELDTAIERISKTPLIRPRYINGTRRYFFRQFPFALVYRTTEETIEIIAIAHSRRKPGYWRTRNKG